MSGTYEGECAVAYLSMFSEELRDVRLRRIIDTVGNIVYYIDRVAAGDTVLEDVSSTIVVKFLKLLVYSCLSLEPGMKEKIKAAFDEAIEKKSYSEASKILDELEGEDGSGDDSQEA